MKMLKRMVLVACALMLVACGGSGTNSSANDEDKKVIGVLVLAEHPALDATVEGMKEELKSEIDEGKVELVVKNAQGDNAAADTIARGFVDDGVDLVYAIGTNAAQSAYNVTKDKNIPVVFNAVSDPVVAELVESNEKPGGNVSGVSDVAPIDKQLAMIKEMLPEAKKVGMIQNLAEVNSKVQIEQAQELAQKHGLEIIVKGVTNGQEVGTAAAQLAAEVDCIYNITDNLVVASTPVIVAAADKENIPVFGAEDGQLEAGLLASDSISYHGLGIAAGTMIREVLWEDANISELSVMTSEDTILYVNQSVADKLGIEIPSTIKDRMTEK